MIQLNIPPVDIEAAIKTITGISLALCVIGGLLGIWLLFRNKRVLEFRQMVNGLCYGLAIYFLERDNYEMMVASKGIYEKLPSYKQMLFSLRPLELEEYIDLDTFADGRIKQAIEEMDRDLPGAANIYRALKGEGDRCPRCNGTGNELASMYRTCEACGGSGVKNDSYSYGK